MRALVDTNIFARLAQVGHQHHPIARDALRKLANDGWELRTVPQIWYEYWAVATRPFDRNGLGFDAATVDSQIRDWQQLFPVCRDERGILDPWLRLVRDHQVQGKQAHDAHLVAAMQRHGLAYLLTFNIADFRRFGEIAALDPAVLMAS